MTEIHELIEVTVSQYWYGWLGSQNCYSSLDVCAYIPGASIFQ